MVDFVPTKKDEKPKDNANSTQSGESQDVQKAKDSATIQQQKALEAKARQDTLLYENNIKDIEEFKVKNEQLIKDFLVFETKRDTEKSTIAKVKSEWEKKLVEVTKKTQELDAREKSLKEREKLIKEREDLLNVVEQKELAVVAQDNLLVNRLKKELTNILATMGANANILGGAGFRRYSEALWDDIELMQGWQTNNLSDHAKDIMYLLQEHVVEQNNKAVEMARNVREYGEVSYNVIVDGLEYIYSVFKELKPDNLP